MTKSTYTTLVRAVPLFGLACGSEEPEVSNAPDYESTVEAALTKAGESAPTMEATDTAAPPPAPTPTDVPPSPTPTVSSPFPPPAPADDAEPLPALAMDDANAFLASVSENEPNCLFGAIPPERLGAVLQSPELADEADRSAVLGCPDHDIRLRLLLTPVLSPAGPLSADSSECLRNSYADTAPRQLLSTIASPSDPGSPGESAEVAAMVNFMVSLSCLSEEEFQVTAPAMGMALEERENFEGVLERVGGQDALAALLTPAAEFPVALLEAALECQVQMLGPLPG